MEHRASSYLRRTSKVVDGMVAPTRGISVNRGAGEVERFGGAFRVKSPPEGLKVVQRGRNQNRFEIVPTESMTFERY
jgi:hypothetical protein